jgi:hypothetical protein
LGSGIKGCRMDHCSSVRFMARVDQKTVHLSIPLPKSDLVTPCYDPCL